MFNPICCPRHVILGKNSHMLNPSRKIGFSERFSNRMHRTNLIAGSIDQNMLNLYLGGLNNGGEDKSKSY